MRVVLWGFGTYGQEMLRQLDARGVELVGVIDRRPARLGCDAGEIAGLGRKSGIRVSPPEEATQLLDQLRPNACLVCTRTSLADVFDQLAVSAQSSVHCITLSEEAFYPWNSSPELAAKLDRLARENGCTISASGSNDTLLASLPLLMGASVNGLKRLKMVIQYNVDLDHRLAGAHGVGLTMDEFEKTAGTSAASYYSSPIADWLCAAFGFRARARESAMLPLQHSESLYSAILDEWIPVGEPSGACNLARVRTCEGPILECHCIGKVFEEGDEDSIECSVSGTPDLHLRIPRPDHVALTCAGLINRLGHLMAAPAGYITTERMPAPRYWLSEN